MKTLAPHQLTAEDDFLRRILAHNPQREIRVPSGIRWGHLINPAPEEAARNPGGGLRVLAICSWILGLLSFNALKAMAAEQPGKLHIVGLVTDDPLDPDARISLKKRFWRYYNQERREEYELGIVESALGFGVPCYTGEVKNDYFREKLAAWDPEVILVSALGQAIDGHIIRYPVHGIYNIHPSDLKQGYGAGPQPWEDLIERRAQTTRVTLHFVSETIDGGQVVGQSPPINVRLADGKVTDDVRLIGEKNLVPVSAMARELIRRIQTQKAVGRTGPVQHIDFEHVFSHEFKKKLMEPIDPKQHGRLLPLPEEDRGFSV